MGGPVEARWRLHPHRPDQQRRLAAALGVNPITAQVLINRGLETPQAARTFLDAGSAGRPSPFALDGMDGAVERLAQAVRDGARIVVYGDYDADGVTATAVLVRGLRAAGAAVDFYIPDRRGEGYGLHTAAVARLAAAGARVIVALDCGTSAAAAAEGAAAAGCDLIVLDHHLAVGALPRAVALVNPALSGAATEFAAAGLAYLAVRGLCDRLSGDFGDDELLALAALGTVADAVPLRGDNRTIVAQGLHQAGHTAIPGLRALMDIAGVQPPLCARDLSHALAPRLNAAGRLAHAADAVQLLLTDDPQEARRIAGSLDRLNRERRALCERVFAEVVDEIEAAGLADQPALVLAREGWHPGVVGIVASQIVERYHRPTVLVALHDGIGKGSARSIPPLHVVDALSRASQFLLAYGGHAMAAGLTLRADAVPRFREAFVGVVASRLSADDLRPVAEVDAEIGLSELTGALAVELERLAPFGVGNSAPVFLSRGLRAAGTRTVGGGAHLRLIVTDGVRTADAIGFRLGDRVELLAFSQSRLDLAYRVELDRWREEPSVELVVEHLWTPDVDAATIASDTNQVLARLFERAGDYLGDPSVGIEHAAAFHTKVVGVTFEGRQALVAEVREGERLRLVRDPRNPRDPHAVKVCLGDGRQLGFLRASLAGRLAPSMDAGARYAATATAVTGGGDRAWGLNIYIERQTPWSGEPGAEDPAARPPRGPGFLEWAEARLMRGRALAAFHREVLGVLADGKRAAVPIGAGWGLAALAAVIGAVLFARDGGPILLVLPRASEVDMWWAALDPWMRGAGLRLLAAHGALPARRRGELAQWLDEGAVDVLLASAAWTGHHKPEARAVVVIADDVAPAHELRALRELFGDRIRAAVGPASVDRLFAALGASEVAPLRARLEPRTNLRVVDHRSTADGEGRNVVLGPTERALVIASDPVSSVALASRLRDALPAPTGLVAYYHHGLPPALRRVLEDLFAAGRLRALVAGSLLAAPAVPSDVSRVIAAGLPPTRLLAAESLGAARVGGQPTVIDLHYAARDLEALARAVRRRFPSREALVQCYHHFREQARGGAFLWPPEGSPLDGTGGPDAEMHAAALEIFVEAGIASAQDTVGSSVRYTLVPPSVRMDLDRSLRYREGVREGAALADLRAWASGPASTILADLARP
ncbi:MAG: single-stranded-DNA-specific exonuclease RecJ [Armatimonadota bacterium]|nr:single-stranded-DNA-specific exonuclease RecJ [Armatimonadota bacterium]